MWNELQTLLIGILAWTLLHYTAFLGYQYFCVPDTWLGVLTAPLTVAMPHCRALVWVFEVSSLSVSTAWTAAAMLISGQLVGMAWGR